MKTKYTYNVAETRFYSVESDHPLTEYEISQHHLGKWTLCSVEVNVDDDDGAYEPTPEQE